MMTFRFISHSSFDFQHERVATMNDNPVLLKPAPVTGKVLVRDLSDTAYRDLGMFLLTAIGWTRTSLGKPTQTIWPSFFPVNSNLQWSLSPSGSFQSNDIDLPETLMLLMGRLLDRVGSVTTSTVPVVSVFTL